MIQYDFEHASILEIEAATSNHFICHDQKSSIITHLPNTWDGEGSLSEHDTGKEQSVARPLYHRRPSL